MPYLIDGDNLLGSCPDISWDDHEARTKLIMVLKKYQENKKSSLLVIFDNILNCENTEGDLSSKFCVLRSPSDSTTSKEITRIMEERFSCFKDVIVVTSDREVKSLAKKKGARTINGIEFYFELKRISRIFGMKEESKKRIETELSDNEVDQWMKIFTE